MARADDVNGIGHCPSTELQALLRELAKRVGDGTGGTQHHRAVADRFPSETITDSVNGTVGGPTRHSSVRSGPARFICKTERKLELQLPVLFELRHRDREQRNRLLLRVIGKRRAYEILG